MNLLWLACAAAAATVSPSALAQADTPPAGYTRCASENQACSFAGTAIVVYGARSSWSTPKTFASSVSCSNAAFGDPLPYATKSCYYQAVSNIPAGYTFCAAEGRTCSFTGTAEVVYGVRSSWSSPRSFTGGTSCSNAVFGDPLPYAVKSCYFKPTAPSAEASAPRLFYTDLDSGPNTGGLNGRGVFVTLYGKNFGASRGASIVTVGGGAVDNYLSWSDTKVVVQLGAAARTGDIAVVNASGVASNGVPFAVRSGAIHFVSATGTGNGAYATPMSPTAAYAAITPGVTFYFRGGTYSQKYGQLDWSNNNYVIGASKSGIAGFPVAFVGYPGEEAVFTGRGSFGLRDSSETVGSHLTIANLRMKCFVQCIGGGAITNAGAEILKSGGKAVRVVGNVMSAQYDNNTQTGILTVANDGWRIYGNELKDTGTPVPENQNHAIYIQVGASDLDLGWNYLHNLRMGHVIQVHTDTPFKYENIRIHDNVIAKGTNGDSRGINVGEALPGTYGSIYGNVISNVGQDFSAIALYSGTWNIFNNTFHNIKASDGMVIISNGEAQNFSGQEGYKPKAVITNNIFYSDGSPAIGLFAYGLNSSSQLSVSNNLYYNTSAATFDGSPFLGNPMFVNAAAGNFRLQSTSPAINKGSATVSTVVLRDADGVPRPQQAEFDIGAFEYKP